MSALILLRKGFAYPWVVRLHEKAGSNLITFGLHIYARAIEDRSELKQRLRNAEQMLDAYKAMLPNESMVTIPIKSLEDLVRRADAANQGRA